MFISRCLFYIFLWLFLLVAAGLLYAEQIVFLAPFLVSLSTAFLIAVFISCKYPRLGRCFIFIYTLILSVELIAVCSLSEYVNVLTLANLDQFQSVGDKFFYRSLLICGLLTLVPLLMRSKKKVKISTDCFFLLVPFCLFLYSYTGPISAFVKTSYLLGKQIYFKQNLILKNQQKQLYAKDTFYIDNVENVPYLAGKNVILFFSEGFSLNLIDGFSPYADLTPNIARYMAKSVWFDNYYNHTAATYRALRGQLTSSYQYIGGRTGLMMGFGVITSSHIQKALADTVISLPQILQQNGYHTYFLSGDFQGFNSYVSTFGFEKVFSANDYLGKNAQLTDQQLIDYLLQLLLSGELQEPFLLAIYNVGTHYGTQSPDKVYTVDGKSDNSLLDVVHNYDDAFGRFDKFIASDTQLAAKTAIVLTADHATFADHNYRASFNNDRECFLSRIPFVVYYQGIEPRRLDAAGRNSLDLAPTLLHMMRINAGRNYFLGCSLFNQTCSYEFDHIYNAGESFLQNHPNQQDKCITVTDKKIKQQIRDFYHLSDNRILK